MISFVRFSGTDSYLTNDALETAVNCALALERPLLVKGEPGTGKTLLAEAVAQSLGLPLIHWPVKSTTRAQDGLYVYDTVQRLYDARFGDGDVKDVRRYIKKGPLGQAFAAPSRVVLLIDEVDKADLEFPNDLLHELDRMRFVVGETGDEIAAKQRPIVVITSNRTREIHDALRRRCLYHWVGYPSVERELDIVRLKAPRASERVYRQVVEFVQRMRTLDLFKSPGVAETIDWTNALVALNTLQLDPASVQDTLGVMLKHQDGLVKMQSGDTAKLLDDLRAKALLN